MKLRFSKSLWTLLIVFLLPTWAFAAGSNVNGIVKGQISDESGMAVSSAMVTIESVDTGLTRSTTSDSKGNFEFQLPGGKYTLKAASSGHSAVEVTSVIVKIGATTDLTIPVVSSAIEEIVTYASADSLIDTNGAETALNLTIEEIAMLPVPRNIESVALLAPGTVAGDSAFGEDKVLVSFGGASVAENIYYIDGMNVTNFRNGLGGASVPFEFYSQFQIKTGGYGAEFGRSLGGVLNATTKRGSNDFHYGLVTYVEPESLRETSPNSIRNDAVLYDLNDSNKGSSAVTDIYLSGPILRDRLFFYVLYEDRVTSEKFTGRGDPETYHDREIDNEFWGGNLLWNITDDHALSYTTFTDKRERVNQQSNFDVDNRAVTTAKGIATDFRGGENHIFRYDGNFGDNFVVSGLYGTNEYDLTSLASTDTTCPYVVDTSNGALPGNNSLFPGCNAAARIDLGGDEREAYRLDLEWSIGDHKIRAGMDNELNTSNSASTYSGTNYRASGAGGVYYRYFTHEVGDTLANQGVVPDANGDGSDVHVLRYRLSEVGGAFETKASAWYIEDSWQISDSFSATVGLRNESFENLNANGDVFIKIDDQLAPRLAFVWSPGGNADSRVFANWGRYHIPVASNTNVRLSGAELGIQRFFVWDGAIEANTIAPVNRDAEGIPTSQEIGSVIVFANGVTPDSSQLTDQTIEPMYQDEWLLGYERAFGDDFVVSARIIHRELASGIDDVLIDEAVDALGYEHTGDAGGYVMTNPGTDITIPYDRFDTGVLETTTFPADLLGYPKADRTYDAIEFTLEKNFSDRWGGMMSYTWSKGKGNSEGYVKSDNGQDDAGITQDFDQPSLMDGAYGYLPNDRRHKFKAFGSFEATEKLLLGASLSISSGRPINMFGVEHPSGTPIYGDTYYIQDPTSGELRQVPRGTAGRTDWVVKLDLSAIYYINLGDRADLELRAEVFNVMDNQSVQERYEFGELAAGIPDPRYNTPQAYQTPRYFRFGAAIRF